MTKPKTPALFIAYHALMAIGAVSYDVLGSPSAALAKAQDIANSALRQLNADYTDEIRRAIMRWNPK